MSTAVGACSLQRQGLVSWFLGYLFQTTPSCVYHQREVLNSTLWYLPEIDADPEFIDKVIKTNYGLMRVPTKERALVDYMRHLDIFELSYFEEGLHEYLWRFGPDELLKVAEHYGVREEMQKWVDQDAEYSDYD